MKTINIGNSGLFGSRIALGCMRMNAINIDEADHVVNSALEAGINYFDHADIYAGGLSEELFGKILKNKPSLREKMYLQTKCGIVRREGVADNIAFDFSKEHIIEAVDGSLKRLNTDHIECLLLHRPDALMEPEEVAEAFDTLRQSGKVAHFGVSNQTPMMIELLKRYLNVPIIANQMQLSVVECPMVVQGLNTNMQTDASIMRDGSIMEYSRLNDITIQAWSPLQAGFFGGTFIDDPDHPELNDKLGELAEKYNVSKSAVAIAWILRLPMKAHVIVGTMNVRHLRDIVAADTVELTREEWYTLYRSVGYPLP